MEFSIFISDKNSNFLFINRVSNYLSFKEQPKCRVVEMACPITTMTFTENAVTGIKRLFRHFDTA